MSERNDSDAFDEFSKLSDFTPLYALFSDSSWTLIPRSVFREEDAARYLALSVSLPENSKVGYIEVPAIDATLIYRRSADAESIANKIHSALSVKPLVLPILNYADRLKDSGHADFILVYEYSGLAYVIIYSKNTFLLANCLEVGKKEDLEYYLLYTSKKLELKDTVPIFLSSTNTGVRGILSEQGVKISAVPLLNFSSPNRESETKEDLIPFIAPECV